MSTEQTENSATHSPFSIYVDI